MRDSTAGTPKQHHTSFKLSGNTSLPKPPHNRTMLSSLRSISVKKVGQLAEASHSNHTNSTTHSKPSNANSASNAKPLVYYLGKGNNEALVRRVLKCRAIWVETEDSTSAFVNLKWQQDQKGFKYERLVDSGLCRAVLNQFEFQQCLSNKEYLFRNLEAYCHKQGLDIWQIVPPTFVLNASDDANMEALKRLVDSYKKYYPKKLKDHQPTDLNKEIQQAKQNLKRVFYNSNLKKASEKPPHFKSCFIDEDGEYLWIVKPTFLNRGRGIQVFSRLDALFRFVSENIEGYFEKSLLKSQVDPTEKPVVIDYVKRNSEQVRPQIAIREERGNGERGNGERGNGERGNGERGNGENLFDGNQYIRVIPRGPALIKTDRFLIQKYLQKPLLMFNRKFDIRIWVLMTHNLKGYVFKEGYIRLSSMEYSCTDSKDNTFMHLTNNAVQKYSEGYGQVADGNQLPYSELKKVMAEKGLNFQGCLESIYEHIRHTLQATTKHLNAQNRKYCFQIYGFDFMIDEGGHPWLIEVNNNPCIEQSSKLLGTLLPRMMDDAFRLTLDLLFYGSVSNGRFPVEGYSNTESMWRNLKVNDQ